MVDGAGVQRPSGARPGKSDGPGAAGYRKATKKISGQALELPGTTAAEKAMRAGKGARGGRFLYCRLEQVQAEAENGHMTDENGWEENKTRQRQIEGGWTVAVLRK
ncbi:hypothetical protein NDU88_004381 [Pleurodeles waltl]|uniref:Uncharacterized protein n=1 Tax=Pleurodeles waltl TaxID=8319 RepID=A0AAV7QI88_PLEWA|nr:hypothetical protein NDU88_004381 [Pleurodeles waltl]